MQNPYAISGNLEGTSLTFSNWSSTPIRDFLYTGVGSTVEFAKRWSTSFFYNAAAGNNNTERPKGIRQEKRKGSKCLLILECAMFR